MSIDIASLGGSISFADAKKGVLVGVDFNELQGAAPTHVTETRGLAEPPPQSNTPILDALTLVGDSLFINGPLYLFQVILRTFPYLIVYGAIFLLTIELGNILDKWAADFLTANLAFLPPYALEFIPYAVGLYVVLVIWNFFDVLFDFHVSVLMPTGIFLRQWGRFENNIRWITVSQLHFGRLKVKYGFTDRAFFVRSDTDHAAMVIDFSLIRAVDVERGNISQQWLGKFGTPPVLITFGTTQHATYLRIHGAYFEENAPGMSRAREFVAAFNKARQPVGVEAEAVVRH